MTIFRITDFIISASGAGIKDQADQFRYVYHALSGNGDISARVVSLDATNPSAMAGVMVRDKLDGTSAYHLSALTAGSGIKAQGRLFDSGLTSIKAGTVVSAPYWVKVQRVSNYLVSYESADGLLWKTLKTEQIEMQTNVYAGLAVTASDNDSLTRAVFDNVKINGQLVTSFASSPISNLIPKEFKIGNYPNPFNPETTIRFDLPKAGNVKVGIYDISGRTINELINGQQQAGSHAVVWDGKNRHGIQSATGIYLYRVQYNQTVKTGKMILMK